MADEQEVKDVQTEPEPTEREKLYQDYAKQQTGTAPEEAVAEEKKETEPEPSPEPEPPKVEKKEETKTEKYVPYEALHAERIKRKAEAEARRAAEERARILQERIGAIDTKEVSDESPITDYDAEIINLRKQLKAVQQLEQDRIAREKREAEQRQYDEVRDRIKKTDQALEEEGYPGFSYSAGAVTERLSQIMQEDRELALAMDNPTGWSKIYKEEIFPQFAEKIYKAKKQTETDGKKELKQRANLSTTTGKATPKPKSPDDMTKEELNAEYLKMRRATQM